jgi:large subunit ribosomal protein L6
MSRIGNKPVKIKEGVTIEVSSDNLVSVKGPKGNLTRSISTEMELKIEDGVLTVKRPTEQKRHKALHGLSRALIYNMVEGVTDGYKKELELVGVGYKATAQNNVLDLSLGYSHNIMMMIPTELKVTAETKKGKNPLVTLEGIDKELIGEVAAKIRELRKVEPYKGKGIRFVGEEI